MKRKTKKLVKRVGMGAGIVGGIAAAGYAATRLLNNSHEDAAAAQQNRADADRALDYEPGSKFSFSGRDVVGDPSVRTSVGLEGGPDDETLRT